MEAIIVFLDKESNHQERAIEYMKEMGREITVVQSFNEVRALSDDNLICLFIWNGRDANPVEAISVAANAATNTLVDADVTWEKYRQWLDLALDDNSYGF